MNRLDSCESAVPATSEFADPIVVPVVCIPVENSVVVGTPLVVGAYFADLVGTLLVAAAFFAVLVGRQFASSCCCAEHNMEEHPELVA